MAAAATAGASALAQTAAPPSATLAQAVDAAWQRAVAAEEARGRAGLAAARQSAAGLRTPHPPSVELGQRTGPGGLRETELALAAPVWRPGQRAALRAAAEAEADAARAAQRAARWRVAGEVRELAWALAAQRAGLAAAREEHETLRALAADVRRRVAAGDLARADALIAEAEVLAAEAAVADLEQQAAAESSRWTMLTGVAPLAEPLEPTPPAPPADDHPERAASRLEVARAERELDWVRRSQGEAPEVAVQWRQERAAAGEPRENSVGLALRIPFGRGADDLAAKAQALAALELARVQAERLAERLAADERTAREALAAAERQLQAAQSRAALLRERAQLLDTSFRAGETPLPDLLRARSAAAQADGALARQRAALGLARARLHQSLGSVP